MLLGVGEVNDILISRVSKEVPVEVIDNYDLPSTNINSIVGIRNSLGRKIQVTFRYVKIAF